MYVSHAATQTTTILEKIDSQQARSSRLFLDDLRHHKYDDDDGPARQMDRRYAGTIQRGIS